MSVGGWGEGRGPYNVVVPILMPEVFLPYITKTCLFKYIENYTTKKERKFSDKKSDIFIFLLKT